MNPAALQGLQGQRNPEIKFTQLFINNEFVDSVNGGTDTLVNPCTEEVLVKVQSADAADVDKAVVAAKAAFKRGSPWRTMDASARGKLLYTLASKVEQNAVHMASLEALNVGKPFKNAFMEIMGACFIMRYYAGWADKNQGKTIPADGGNIVFTYHEPIGICGQIIPWNFPFMMVAFKISPALAMGNVVVLKPSEMTPLSALFLGSLIKEVGFPEGVINIIPGRGDKAGNAIAAHPDILKVAFTGSTRVGKLLGSVVAESVKRLTLELGGKSPLVITEDVNVDQAVFIAQAACFGNSGQVCLAATRTFVHESIYEEFVKKSVALAKTRVLGDNFDPKTVQGPQVSETQFKNVLRLIQKGIEEGAKLETGGKRFGEKGYFIEPTIFSNVTDDMTIAKEEIFGPVMSILKYSDFKDVIERSNNTNYGLASGILTKDMDKAFIFSKAIEAGSVYVNTYSALSAQIPFGGYKHSGYGREMGENGLEAYYQVKTVVIKGPQMSL